jgi:hypothetical protein
MSSSNDFVSIHLACEKYSGIKNEKEKLADVKESYNDLK